MHIITATEARSNFYRLMDEAALEPVLITGKRGNTVLISEDEWRGIQETLYLTSIPGMKESLLAAEAEPTASCATDIVW